MIRYFEKIENLGVFSNYKRDREMKSFERFNLIYGINGSGKTTLSRLFTCLNEGNSREFPDLKYEIITDAGKFRQGTQYSCQIRVFNSEYVRNNIGQIDGILNPIYIIGKENKSLVESIEKDKVRLFTLEKERDIKCSEIEKLKKSKGEIFTDIATKISESAYGAKIRTYNKRKAEDAYGKLVPFEQLTDLELEYLSKEMNMVALKFISDHTPPIIKIRSNRKTLFEAIEYLLKSASSLTQKNTISSTIDRLVKNSELANWIERGREIHKKNEDPKCEYCRQIIPEEREKELASHFNKSDSDLKEKINQSIKLTKIVIEEIETIKNLRNIDLYPEFKDEWSHNVNIIDEEREKILSILNEVNVALKEKLNRRTQNYRIELTTPSNSTWDVAWQSIKSLIQKNNVESENYQQRLDRNFEKIQKHFLGEIDDSIKEIKNKINKLRHQIEIYTNGNLENNEIGINDLMRRIKENQAKVSNSHRAADDLSQKLASFLGRDDLKFESEGEGYRIMRFGRAAKRLSEGEKTAIAFLYFVVGLQDQDFNINDGIVVIDDPISSLDSSSMYQAFSYLKESSKEAKQLFLLTHNFEFLKLILDWFHHLGKNKTTYWMLHCSITDKTIRETEIKLLDKALVENKNELAYLIKILINFRSDGTIDQSYPIPNIMRKVLETFLENHSSGKNLYEKLEKVDFDKTKKHAIYKFTNDQSHPTSSGLDPALVGETQTNINHLLNMIKTVAPVYYDALNENF